MCAINSSFTSNGDFTRTHKPGINSFLVLNSIATGS